MILSGGYRASGNLPVRRYTKRLVQTSKSDKSNDPNGKQVGESAARGRFVAENLYLDKSASIAFDQSNVNGLSPNPYYKQKEETNRFIAEKFPLFLLV